MPQADPEDGHSFGGQCPDDLGSVRYSIGVAGPVRQKDSVRVLSQRRIRRCIGGDYGYAAIVLIEQSEDVALDSVVVGDDVVTRARISPAIGLSGRHA